MTGRQGRRCKQILVDLSETIEYWNFKEEGINHTSWRHFFRSCCGPVVGPDYEWMNEWLCENSLKSRVQDFKPPVMEMFIYTSTDNHCTLKWLICRGLYITFGSAPGVCPWFSVLKLLDSNNTVFRKHLFLLLHFVAICSVWNVIWCTKCRSEVIPRISQYMLEVCMLAQTEDTWAVSQLDGTLLPYAEIIFGCLNEHFLGLELAWNLDHTFSEPYFSTLDYIKETKATDRFSVVKSLGGQKLLS
jgi:hypothetical protein